MPDEPRLSSAATMRLALNLLDEIRRQYSVRGIPREDGSLSPLLRLGGLRTMLRLRFDQRMGNAQAQGELEDADEKTLCYRNIFDDAAEAIGLSDADLRRIYIELDAAAV